MACPRHYILFLENGANYFVKLHLKSCIVCFYEIFLNLSMAPGLDWMEFWKMTFKSYLMAFFEIFWPQCVLLGLSSLKSSTMPFQLPCHHRQSLVTLPIYRRKIQGIKSKDNTDKNLSSSRSNPSVR